MNFSKSKVIVVFSSLIISAFILGVGPHPTNVSLDMSLFLTKLAFVFGAIGWSMESKKS